MTNAPKKTATTTKSKKTVSFEDQQSIYVDKAKKQALRTAMITSLVTLSGIVICVFLFLGPDFMKDFNKETNENIDTIKYEYAKIERKQEELARQQAVLQQRVTEFANADLYEKINSLSSLSSEVRTISDRLNILQKTKTGQAILSSSAGDLQSLVLGMQGRVDNLEGALELAQQQNSSLADVLEGVSGNELKAAAMLLAVSQLRSSVMQGNTYKKDLETVRALAGDDPELQASIDKIAPLAASGIMSRQALSRELKGLASEIALAEFKGEEVSWKDKAAARLNKLIKVEKEGLAEGQDTQAVVSRAQLYMEEGNIQAAIQELQSLEGEPAKVANPWLEQAIGRMNAENVGPELSGNVLELLKKTTGAAVDDSSPILFSQ